MIPAEAVEAAMIAFANAPLDPPTSLAQINLNNQAQMTLALEAAAPHMLVAAKADAWDECEAATYEIRLNPQSDAWEPVKDNPYRTQDAV